MNAICRRVSVLALCAAAGCASGGLPSGGAPAPMHRDFEAISLRGDTLRSAPVSDAARPRLTQQLEQAKKAYDQAPANVDSIIWYARRLAYLGRFRDAIDVYTRGIALHPDDARLYRHRGHRYITVRELDHAIADLARAESLARGKPDEVEPDGQPNARNIPIGTLRSNIDYHLALAWYLKGDYARALPVYDRELRNARNDDRRVSIVFWYYLALRRLARDADASALLAGLPRDMHIIENDTYNDLLRVFRGELMPDSVLAAAESSPGGISSIPYVTVANGIATWHLVNGRRSEALGLYRTIVSGAQWPAFGFIAAEAELARNR